MSEELPLMQWLEQAAREVGLDRMGIAPVAEYAELRAFPEWIAAGHAGDMDYLSARTDAGELKRESLKHIAPWARSVIVCAVNYNTAQPYSTQVTDASKGWISRYAWAARDYHDEVLERVRRLEAMLLEAAASGTLPGFAANLVSGLAGGAEDSPPMRTRCYVDTGPLVERVVAKHAGIGWIGKNTCIIDQKLGSWLFLGVMLTSLELTPSLPAADRCGSCTRCIDACPTEALLEPYKLDARRCISYLTIEKRGDWVGELGGSENEALLAGMGRHVFGCDICQDVCPWNRKAPATGHPAFQPREGLVNPSLEWLAEISEDEFRKVFRGSPIKRTKRSGLRRNALIAMGNSGEKRFTPLLTRLSDDEDPSVASAARRAVSRLKMPTAEVGEME